ncbi:hypothetical protein V6N13_119744 [Hibiscus sabdariffa]
MKAAGGSSVYYEPDPFTCKCYPDFPYATMSLPRFPFFPLTHGSPPVAMPSAHAGDPTEIKSCESQLYNIEACFQDIVNVLLTNKLKIGPACCKSSFKDPKAMYSNHLERPTITIYKCSILNDGKQHISVSKNVYLKGNGERSKPIAA